jgi:hypothetical protein
MYKYRSSSLVVTANSRVTLSRKYSLVDSASPADGKFRHAKRSSALVVFFCALSMLGDWKTATAANDIGQLEIQLEGLRAAKDITLMLIPRGMSFRGRIKGDLPKLACVYQMGSAEGLVSSDLINILRTGILEYERGTAVVGEAIIGVLFRGNNLSQEFYFQDWGGRQNVAGVSGEYRILASANLPDQLRALVLRPGVVLVSNSYNYCSPS